MGIQLAGSFEPQECGDQFLLFSAHPMLTGKNQGREKVGLLLLEELQPAPIGIHGI